ncbi:hypothetical protein GCM10008955_29810 [Deinococcus malanensis]|uniref:Uncharacterized protein n=1 Tax=Deinococcus malanensis TaxID=1706855 RepID=A0ABQ2EZK7_9DEIO|nr:hypothetical protein GCM10008955_29810 [Deinococcus malanensis]
MLSDSSVYWQNVSPTGICEVGPDSGFKKLPGCVYEADQSVRNPIQPGESFGDQVKGPFSGRIHNPEAVKQGNALLLMYDGIPLGRCHPGISCLQVTSSEVRAGMERMVGVGKRIKANDFQRGFAGPHV